MLGEEAKNHAAEPINGLGGQVLFLEGREYEMDGGVYLEVKGRSTTISSVSVPRKPLKTNSVVAS